MRTGHKLVLLFVLAVGLRLLLLASFHECYLGRMRISDASFHHRLALSLLAGDPLADAPFWKAPFYSYFLALFYLVAGSALIHIQLFHLIIGSLNCLLLYLLAARVFSERVAWWSSLLAAVYPVNWLFDIQALDTNLTVTFYLALLWLMLGILTLRGEANRLFTSFTGGFVAGAAIILQGLALFVPLALVFWLWKRGTAPRFRRLCVIAFLVGTFIPIVTVTLRNMLTYRQLILISSNPGLNLYVGNHPHFTETFNLRNGLEFLQFRWEICRQGITTADQANAYHLQRTLEHFALYPFRCLLNLLRKLLLLSSGEELKRNFHFYGLPQCAPLLNYLIFRVRLGSLTLLAFPSGLIIPFMLVGLIASFRGMNERVVLFFIIAGAHCAAVWLFIVCTRYRLPGLFLLFPFVVRGIHALKPTSQARRHLLPWLWLVLGFLLANPLASLINPLQEKGALAEHQFFQLTWQQRDHQLSPEAVIQQADAIIAFDPSYPEPYELAATLSFEELQQPEKAAWYWGQLRRLLPLDPFVWHNSGITFHAMQKAAPAERCFRQAARLCPGFFDSSP